MNGLAYNREKKTGRAHLKHVQQTLLCKGFRKDVVHPRRVVGHDLVGLRITGHRDDGCTLVEFSNEVRRRNTVQLGHDNVLEEIQHTENESRENDDKP